MKPRTVNRLGPVFYKSTDSRPGYEASNYSFDYLHTDFVSNLYGVYSDGSRPWTVYKNQDYTISETIDHFGEFGTLRIFPNGTEMISEYGPIGPSPSLVPVGDANNAFNNALSKLAEVVRGQTDLSIDGFEAKQTVKLARNILNARKQAEKVVLLLLATTTIKKIPLKYVPRKGTRGYLDYQRRRQLRNTRSLHEKADILTRRPIKDVGSAWLQFTYGLKPTLQTIYDLVNRESIRVGNSLHVQTKTDKGYRKNVRGKVKYEAFGLDKNDPNRTFNMKYSSLYMTEIGGRYQPGTTIVESLSRLTSLNPASIAWELTPFSFVIDWFLDIGGYLRNMETALLSNMLGSFEGFVTNLEVHHTRESSVGNGLAPNGYAYFGSTLAYGRLVIKRRRKLSTFPLPRPPRFTADLSSGRMINAAALLTTLLGRKR